MRENPLDAEVEPLEGRVQLARDVLIEVVVVFVRVFERVYHVAQRVNAVYEGADREHGHEHDEVEDAGGAAMRETVCFDLKRFAAAHAARKAIDEEEEAHEEGAECYDIANNNVYKLVGENFRSFF